MRLTLPACHMREPQSHTAACKLIKVRLQARHITIRLQVAQYYNRFHRLRIHRSNPRRPRLVCRTIRPRHWRRQHINSTRSSHRDTPILHSLTTRRTRLGRSNKPSAQ